MIAGLGPARQADLWAGLGLALAYAGGADVAALSAVRLAAGERWKYLAQGAAFGAEAHARAGHAPDDTADALRILSSVDAEAAVRTVRYTRDQLPQTETPEMPRYEMWRCAVQRVLTE
jgi:hypothetical protein